MLKNKWITIRTTPQNKQQLHELSVDYGISQSEILRQLIRHVYKEMMQNDNKQQPNC